MSLTQDLRFGARLLRRDSWFTIAAVLSLALGIGANTAIFTLIDHLMLRHLPVAAPERLVELVSQFPGDPRISGMGWKHYVHVRDNNHVFTELIASSPARFQVRAGGDTPQTVIGDYVSGTFFGTLGVTPRLGRLIGPGDDVLGPGAATAVLSWTYWRDRFQSNASVIGSSIVVDGVTATIVGVAPQGFTGLLVGRPSSLWIPIAMEPLIQPKSRLLDGSFGVQMMGRLRPGISIEQAQAEVTVLNQWRIEDLTRSAFAEATARPRRSLGGGGPGGSPRIKELRLLVEAAASGFSSLRDRFAQPLLVLMLVVGLLLALACTNVASLMLARAAARQREIAVRVSLGAGRWRLARQMLVEAFLISMAAAVIGIALSYVGAGALVRTLNSGRLGPSAWMAGIDLPVGTDLRVLAFTCVVAMLTGVIFGLAPVWGAFSSLSGRPPAMLLREQNTAGDPRSRAIFGKGLVVLQVSLSIVLLSAAVLFVGHLSNLRGASTGFDRHGVLLVSFDASSSGYERLRLSQMYQEFLGRVTSVPGVLSATFAGATPISGAGAARFVTVDGFVEPPEDRRYVPVNWVGPHYFETLRTPLLSGRDFAFSDENGPRVAIVNQAFARYYFRGANPLGRHLTFDRPAQPYEIVAVVGDAKYTEIHEAKPRTVYLNAFQDSRGMSHQLVARTTPVSQTRVLGDVRRLAAEVLPSVSIGKTTTLADQVDAVIVPERIVAAVSGGFGLFGAALAALGVYGLLAFTVTRRTTEIAVRMALGATTRDIMSMVMRGAAVLVAAGLAAGAPVAYWIGRVANGRIEDLGVQPIWPVIAAAAGLAIVALTAAALPARRAARVEPMQALRR